MYSYISFCLLFVCLLCICVCSLCIPHFITLMSLIKINEAVDSSFGLDVESSRLDCVLIVITNYQ